MSTPRQYCGECFAWFKLSSDMCPRCGAIASGLSERDYGEKLLHALQHPLANVRLRAVIALGRRARADVAEALIDCALRHPTDVIQGLEIVDGLERIARRHPETVRALQRLAKEHPAHIIREAAGVGLARTEATLSFHGDEPT
jgi:hypothetical protein